LRWLLLRTSLSLATGAGLLGALIVAGEAGTGQMMGWQGVAGIIHSAFVTEHDFQKAALRALMLVLCLSPLVLLAAWLIARSVVGRPIAINSLSERPIARHSSWFTAASCLPMIIGLTGLVRPLTNGGLPPAFRDAWLTLTESAVATIELVMSTTLVVACVMLWLGWLMARHVMLWRVVLAVGLMLIALPQSIHGLGWLMLRAHLPISPNHGFFALEPAAVLSARWSLVASHFAALVWQEIPTSSLDAARLSGLSRRQWLLLIARPVIFNRVLPLAFLVSLLCLGDASAVALLQRPGWSTYATRLFSIMDNAPERQIAALCLVYLALPAVLAGLWFAVSRLNRLFHHRSA
jgi:ABC-type Fe3+ transport system permease subunit